MNSANRVPSPCTGVCRIDPRSRGCVGCGRTPREITDWLRLSDAERRSVLADLAARRAEPAAR